MATAAGAAEALADEDEDAEYSSAGTGSNLQQCIFRFWWLWLYSFIAWCSGMSISLWVVGVFVLCCGGWMLGYHVWDSAALRRVLPMAPVRDVRGERLKTPKKKRRASLLAVHQEFQDERLKKAWARVWESAVACGLCGEMARKLQRFQQKHAVQEQELAVTKQQEIAAAV